MHVVIHALEAHVVDVSAEAKQAVRLTFNPSANKRVERLKSLAAAFISECDAISSEFHANRKNQEDAERAAEAGRALAVAKTNMQTASMWAVLGATTNA